MSAPAAGDLRIEPDPSAWQPAIDRWLARRDGDRARRFREQLGLPTERQIIMTGHQAQVWHPGILAKYVACAAAAQSLGADAAWLVVDQDDVDPSRIAYPAVNDKGVLVRHETTLGPPQPAGVATASLPAVRITQPPDDSRSPASIRGGISAIARAMAAAGDAPNAARQAGRAIAALLAPILPPSAATIDATDLGRTDLFRDLFARMLADPEACVGAYNRAVAARPEAGMAALQSSQASIELPLWRLRTGRVRQRVTTADAAAIPSQELAPRALFMTAMLRLAGCDFFIHGTGGGEYDRVTDAWIGAWLGEPLAPTAVVTATLRLDLGRPDPPTPADLARARWRLHRAAHDPALLGLEEDALRKRALVGAVAAARQAGEPALPPYRGLHAFLDEYRRAHAADLAALEAEAESLAARLAEAGVVNDRTWPFPLYPAESIAGLARAVRARFGVA